MPRTASETVPYNRPGVAVSPGSSGRDDMASETLFQEWGLARAEEFEPWLLKKLDEADEPARFEHLAALISGTLSDLDTFVSADAPISDDIHI
jgi:hypothetical protein